MLAGVKYSAGERFTKTVQNLKNRWHLFINTAISMNAYGFREGSKMLTTIVEEPGENQANHALETEERVQIDFTLL